MKDGGWEGQFVHVLYDAQGKPLMKQRIVGFVKTR